MRKIIWQLMEFLILYLGIFVSTIPNSEVSYIKITKIVDEKLYIATSFIT